MGIGKMFIKGKIWDDSTTRRACKITYLSELTSAYLDVKWTTEREFRITLNKLSTK